MMRLLLAALVALLAPAALAQTCTTSWTNAAGGAWETPTNWSDGVPDASDTACISLTGTYTVSQSSTNRTVSGLVVGGASGVQTLTTFNVFSISGDAVVRPSGRWEILNRTPGGADGVVVSGTLTVEGLLVQNSGAQLLGTGGTLYVAPGGTVRVVGNGVNAGGPAARFRVRGLLEATGCPETTSGGSCQVDAPLEVMGGTVRAGGGVFFVRGSGTMAGGTLDAVAGASLYVSDDVISGGSPFVLTGAVTGTPAGLVYASGISVAAGAGGATLAIGGTGLQLTGSAFLASAGGEFRNTGLLVHAPTGSNFASIDGATLRNEGRFMMPGVGFGFRNGGLVRNEASGVIEISNRGGLGGVGGSAGRVENAGLVLANGSPAGPGSGATAGTIGIPYDGLPGSILRVETGRLDLQAGGSFRDATFDVPAAAVLLLSNGGAPNDRFTVSGTLSGTPAGDLAMSSVERLEAGPGGVTLAFGGTGLRLGDASTTLRSAGGGFVNTGLLVWGNGTSADAVEIENRGTLRMLGRVPLLQGAVLRNVAGATVELHSFMEGDGRFENAGLVVTGGTGFAASFGGRLRSLPGSELRALAGGPRLDLDAPGSQTVPVGTRVTGTGSVFFPPDLVVEGTVSPGTPEQPIANLQPVSTFRLSPQARVVIDVGAGGVSDRLGNLDFNGYTYALAGTLVVRLAPDYTPAIGDVFTVVRNGVSAVGGAFDAVVVEGDSGGLTFVLDTSNPGAAVLRVVAAVTVEAPVATTPEGAPVSFVLRHPASASPFSISFAIAGTATRFADYTLGATQGAVRAEANTTQTVVSLFPRRDANTSEGSETVTLRAVVGGQTGPGEMGEATVTIQDGPSSDALALDGVVPARGANLGTVTPTFFGTGFGEGTTVRLVGGTTVTGARVALDPRGAGASATFDLEGAPPGTYDVVVERGGQSATLADAFTVVEGEAGVPVWADVSGTPAPRFGRWSTYTLTVGNDGDADLYDTFVVLRLTAGLEYEVGGLILPQDPVPGTEAYVGLDVGTAIVVPIYVYNLPAHATRAFEVRVRPVAPIEVGDGVGVSYELYPPNPLASFTYSGDFADFDADVAADIPTNWGVIGGALAVALEEARANARSSEGVAASEMGRLLDGGPNNPWPRDDQDMNLTDLQDEYGGLGAFDQYRGEVAANLPDPWGETFGFALGTFILGAAVVAGSIPIGTAAIIGGGALAIGSIVSAGQSASRISCSRNGGCGDGGGSGGTGGGAGGTGGGTGGAGGGPGGGVGGGAAGKTGGSRDPNDKYGPSGVAGLRYYDPATVATPYVVRFENVDTATFPAQEVVVVDTLDADVFDLSTFSLGPIRWGDGNVVTPPPGSTTYEAEVDLSPGLDATLLITAALDEASGRVVWHFATLDPETGDLPEDGLVGFLPPNGTSPEGEGSVSFTVETLDGLPTGTSVSNQAEIVFDVNEPIATGVWTNTVDVSAPMSSVDPLSPTATSPVTVTVSAGDAGSGLYLYTLFASQDGGPFEPYATSAEPVFVGSSRVDLQACKLEYSIVSPK